MKTRKLIILSLSLAALLVCGVLTAVRMGQNPPTYDGRGIDLVALCEDPASYDNTDADGAAAVIVNENLEKTASENVVFSIVFNFRGYDTLGESFILIAAISGTMAILRAAKKNRKKEEDVHEAL